MFIEITDLSLLPMYNSAKLIDIYRNRHNITASTGMRDPAVATTGISELIYEVTKPAPMEPDNLDDDLVNAWATGLADDGLWNNAPAMNRVRYYLICLFIITFYFSVLTL